MARQFNCPGVSFFIVIPLVFTPSSLLSYTSSSVIQYLYTDRSLLLRVVELVLSTCTYKLAMYIPTSGGVHRFCSLHWSETSDEF